jgi:hypothetical protein
LGDKQIVIQKIQRVLDRLRELDQTLSNQLLAVLGKEPVPLTTVQLTQFHAAIERMIEILERKNHISN